MPLLAIPLGWVLFTGLGRDPSEIPSPFVGKPMPAFSLSALDGQTSSTPARSPGPPPSSTSGWSGASRNASTSIRSLWTPWPPGPREQVQLVGILFDTSLQDALEFLVRYGDGGWPNLDDLIPVRWPWLLACSAPPETFFVDADGIVRVKHYGPLTEAALAEYLVLIGVTP